MRTRVWGGAAIAAVASVLLGAHPVPRQAVEPSRQVPLPGCEPLPDGVTEIAGLRTAIAIRSPQSSTLRLQLSSEPHGCREPAPVQEGECHDLWQFGLTLVPESQKPGVYDLANEEIRYSDFIVQTTPADGCNEEPECSIRGTGAGRVDDTIEIFSATDTCVTGRILRRALGWSTPPPPDLTGGFRAEVCAREP
jgi:hypothetical protein